jgi:exopolysaccharide biosynthesis predicted pyruvyltransferase EpsI
MKLVVCVLSCWKNSFRHRQIIEYWNHVGIETIIACGRGKRCEHNDRVVQLDCGDLWEDLPEKVVHAFEYIRKYMHATHVFKIDDTSDINAPPCEIKRVLLNSTGDYVGFKTFSIMPHKNFMSKYHFGRVSPSNFWYNRVFTASVMPPYWAGGRGYRVSLDIFMSELEKWRQTSAISIPHAFIYEDAMVGTLMKNVGMTPAISNCITFDATRELTLTDMEFFLQQYSDREIVWFPGAGNAGDSLIAYGCYQLFKRAGIKIAETCAWTDILRNKCIITSGAGNLVGKYPHFRTFLKNNAPPEHGNEILLLPQTITSEDNLIHSLQNNVKIICREPKSYEYVYSNMKNKANVFLSHDMAFHIQDDLSHFIHIKPKLEVLYVIRTCKQEATDMEVPLDNVDLSFTLQRPGNTSDPDICKQVTYEMFEAVASAKLIITNRLHVAIAGALLGRQVHLYPSNYWKIPEIYNYSLKDRYPCVKMCL